MGGHDTGAGSPTDSVWATGNTSGNMSNGTDH